MSQEKKALIQQTGTIDEKQEKNEQEDREKTAKDLDEIEKILNNSSSMCVNLMLLVFYVILIVQIVLEYRVADVQETISAIERYVNARLQNEVSELQSLSDVYDQYFMSLIPSLHDHYNYDNQFSFINNPQQIQDEDTNLNTNQSQYLFLQNYNYYLCSVLTIKLKSIADSTANQIMSTILNFQYENITESALAYLDKSDNKAIIIQLPNPPDDLKDYIVLKQTMESFEVVLYFKNEIEKEQSLEMLAYVTKLFTQSPLLHISHDIYAINPVTEVLIRRTQLFDIGVEGHVDSLLTYTYGIYYNLSSKVQNGAAFAIAIKAIFALVVFMQILLNIGIKVFFMVVKFISTRVPDFDTDLIYIIAQRTINLIYVIFWFQMFVQFQQLEFSTEVQPSQLDSFDAYIEDFTSYQSFAVFTLIISIYDVIKILSTFFPSFGVLTYTFVVSGKDILIFISFTALMLISFIIIGNIMFGPNNLALSSLYNSTFFCLEFLNGVFKFYELTQLDPVLGYIYGLLFFIIFVLVLLPYFFGIIIYTYGELRKKMQLMTQALAEIAADKSTAATLLWINLIFFIEPKTEEETKKEELAKQKRAQERAEAIEKEKKKELEDEMAAEKRQKRNQDLRGYRKLWMEAHPGIIPKIYTAADDEKKEEHVEEEEEVPIDKGTFGKLKIGQSVIRPPTSSRNKAEDKSVNKSSGKAEMALQTPLKDGPVNLNLLPDKAPKAKKLDAKDIFMYNFLQLDIINVVKGLIGMGQPDLLTKQQRIDEITKKTAEIQKRRIDERDRQTKQKKKTLFSNLVQGFFHIIFLIFLILTIQNQTLKGLAFEQEQYIKNYFSFIEFDVIQQFQAKKFTIDDIETSVQFDNFMENVILRAAAPLYNNQFNQENLRDFNLMIGSQPTRITFRLMKSINIPFFGSNKELIFEARPANDLTPSKGDASGELTINFYKSGQEYLYIGPGSTDTAQKGGGFAFKFDSDMSSSVDQYQTLSQDAFIAASTGLVTIEFVIYNPINDFYSYTSIQLVFSPTGTIHKTIDISSFPLVLYSGSRLTRLFYEIILLLFHARFWVLFLREWREVWMSNEAIEFTPFDMPKDNLVSYWLNMDVENTQVKDLVIGIIKRIQGFGLRFLIGLKMMVSVTFFNILLISGIVLTFVEVIFWLQIVFNPFRMNFDFRSNFNEIRTSSTLFNDFQQYSQLYYRYNIMASFIMWNEMLRILFYFQFSAKLSLVLDIIASASVDIIFFMTMFIVIILGFGCVGFMEFGYMNTDFSNLLRSIVKCFEIFQSVSSLPKGNGDQYSLTDLLFYFALALIVYLVLVRMLIAILDGHFQDVVAQNAGEPKSLFDTIMAILQDWYNEENRKKAEKDLILNKDKKKLKTENSDDEGQEEEEKESESEQFNDNPYAVEEEEELNQEEPIDTYSYRFRLYMIILRDRIEDLIDWGLEQFEYYKNELFKMLFNKPSNDKNGNQDTVETQFQVALDFHEDKKGNIRFEDPPEYAQYGQQQAIQQQDDKFVTIDVTTWKQALERGIKDIASTSLDFSKYYTPLDFKDEWLKQFHSDDTALAEIMKYLQAGEHELRQLDLHLSKYLLSISRQFLQKMRDDLLNDTKETELKNKSFITHLDNLLIFFTNCCLVKDFVIQQSSEQLEQIRLPTHQKQKTDQFEITFIVNDLDEQPAQDLKRGTSKIKNSTQKSIQQRTQLEPFQGPVYTRAQLMEINGQQLCRIFTKLSTLNEIWNSISLTNKLNLWFGSTVQDNQENIHLQLHHKVTFWNQTSWDKKTFFRVPNLKDMISDGMYTQTFILGQEKFSYLDFATFWNDLIKVHEQPDQKQEKKVVVEPHQISERQLKVIDYLLRTDQLMHKLSQVKEFKAKLKILKSSHIGNEHKLIIWMLMSPIERVEMAMQTVSKEMSQFMILMMIEELYDNLFMMQKIESDLTTTLNAKIYQMYHNFAEYNALCKASEIRVQYKEQTVHDPKDIEKFKSFLEQKLHNSYESLEKYSAFLLDLKKGEDVQQRFKNTLDLVKHSKK